MAYDSFYTHMYDNAYELAQALKKQENIDYKSIGDVYTAWLSKHPMLSHEQVETSTHKCTGVCDFEAAFTCIGERDIFICRRSGLIHWCGASNCNKTTTNSDNERVCTLRAVIFGSTYQVCDTTVNFDDDRMTLISNNVQQEAARRILQRAALGFPKQHAPARRIQDSGGGGGGGDGTFASLRFGSGVRTTRGFPQMKQKKRGGNTKTLKRKKRHSAEMVFGAGTGTGSGVGATTITTITTTTMTTTTTSMKRNARRAAKNQAPMNVEYVCSNDERLLINDTIYNLFWNPKRREIQNEERRKMDENIQREITAQFTLAKNSELAIVDIMLRACHFRKRLSALSKRTHVPAWGNTDRKICEWLTFFVRKAYNRCRRYVAMLKRYGKQIQLERNATNTVNKHISLPKFTIHFLEDMCTGAVCQTDRVPPRVIIDKYEWIRMFMPSTSELYAIFPALTSMKRSPIRVILNSARKLHDMYPFAEGTPTLSCASIFGVTLPPKKEISTFVS